MVRSSRPLGGGGFGGDIDHFRLSGEIAGDVTFPAGTSKNV
jgi:hypothetical protein